MGKRLTDLHVVGQEVVFDDPSGGPGISVYVKKLQPFELEVAMNRANVQRAKVLTLKRFPPEHEEVLPFGLQAEENFTEEERVGFIAAEEISQAYRSVDSRLANEDEWAKEDYLIGLQDSWEELKDHYHLDEFPEQHADAVRVFEELKRFNGQVDAEFEKERARILREYRDKSNAEILESTVAKLIELKGDMKWMEEYKLSQIWLSVREPKDHSKRYFLSREEINEVHPDILRRLLDVYDDITVSPEEGKD